MAGLHPEGAARVVGMAVSQAASLVARGSVPIARTEVLPQPSIAVVSSGLGCTCLRAVISMECRGPFVSCHVNVDARWAPFCGTTVCDCPGTFCAIAPTPPLTAVSAAIRGQFTAGRGRNGDHELFHFDGNTLKKDPSESAIWGPRVSFSTIPEYVGAWVLILHPHIPPYSSHLHLASSPTALG